MTGPAIQNDTITGGSRDLEVYLRSIPAEPFKNSQPTFSSFFFFFFFFSFSDQRYLLYVATIEKLAPRKL